MSGNKWLAIPSLLRVIPDAIAYDNHLQKWLINARISSIPVHHSVLKKYGQVEIENIIWSFFKMLIRISNLHIQRITCICTPPPPLLINIWRIGNIPLASKLHLRKCKNGKQFIRYILSCEPQTLKSGVCMNSVKAMQDQRTCFSLCYFIFLPSVKQIFQLGSLINILYIDVKIVVKLSILGL